MTDSEREGEALHEQRDWLKVTLASIGDAVVTTDTDGRVTFLNLVAESLTGWDLGDARGEPLESIFRIINQDTRKTVESPTVRALRDGVIVGLANHTLLISKDGTERPIDDSAAPIRNERDEVAGVVLVFRDITERYRQEQTIQETLDYAHNIIATLREPFLVINGNLKVHTANRAFYEHFRTTPDQTEERFVYDLGHGQWDSPRLRSLLGEVLDDHHPVVDHVVEQDFPDIGRRFMLLNAVRIRKPGNHSSLILLAIQDITERKQSEIALRNSEVRYRRLFESAKDGILILDFDSGRIEDANPFLYQLLDCSESDLLGKQLWEIGIFEDKTTSQSMVREMQVKGYCRYDDLPLQTRHGRRIEVEIVANAYHEDHHSVIQCNIRDISERRQLERAKIESEALADLHRRKDEFLAMLSHELRNPLAPISNAVQLLRLQQNENALQESARTTIERQVSQLTRLIDDLMEISRITTGRVKLRPEQVTLAGILERSVEASRPALQQHGHELTMDLPSEPIWLFADATRLEQVFVNLLTNAAKYTPQGGQIHVTALQEQGESIVRIRDTGAGIPPELLPRIFDLFTQAERTLDRTQGGLGIGLALVRRLVELHRGRVEVHSSLGHGSEFSVHLPLMPAPTWPEASKPAAPRPAATKPTGLARKVLVVDDNVDAATSLASLVRAFHHDVRIAYDGPGAVAEALQYRPDLVLLDIGLPRLNGYEVARKLRADPGLKGVLLVAVTGYGQEADRQQSRDAGFDHHLVKPVEFGEVERILARLDEPSG